MKPTVVQALIEIIETYWNVNVMRIRTIAKCIRNNRNILECK